MKRRFLRSAVAVLASLASMGAHSATYTAAVSQIQPNHEALDCIFFRLSGITGISPASAGDWFAIPRDSAGAMEAFAVLLTSRTKAMAVTVQTSNEMACGYARALNVIL
jgi:hypothetical protein